MEKVTKIIFVPKCIACGYELSKIRVNRKAETLVIAGITVIKFSSTFIPGTCPHCGKEIVDIEDYDVFGEEDENEKDTGLS